MNIFKSVLFPVMLLFCTFRAAAVPAYPYPVTITQPDGTQLTVVMKGDEYHHYHTTADGYLIVKNETGVFNYARRDARGILTDTRVKATNEGVRSASERAFISNLSTNTNLKDISGQMRANRIKQKAASVAPPARFPISGSPRSLVILVNFSDLAYVTANPTDAFTAMLNEEGYDANGGTGSARDYFRDNSMGTFSPRFDVVGPYKLPQTLKYYGENDADDYDMNPVQMIVDACAKADSAGVDFTIYDTDGDGLVDNVFVYYAGYNEAEWGGDDTVWPHRWDIQPGYNYNGTEASLTFDGKRVMDYACSSELKGKTGISMAGIGTFTHEFGHVLGLADMYATDGAEHQTLSYWNIMDSGAYLNSGRTPPAYNAFERFQLGYLAPELLQNYPVNVSLDTLLSSNKAYLISPTNTFDMNRNNPVPSEFFLLENRQKKGWDKYLPGHGMLVYRINYNQNDWDYNEPNNNPDKMGVDIMEADGIANDNTLAGDPFPGTANKTSYELVLRSGTKLYKKITNITETAGKITFNIEKMAAIETTAATLYFTSEVNTTSALQSVRVTTVNLSGTGLTLSITGTDASMFTFNGNGTLPLAGGEVFVSFTPTTEGSKTAVLKITDGTVERQINLNGTATMPALGIPVVPTDVNSIVADNAGFTAVWNPVNAAESYRLNVYTKMETGSVFNNLLSENFGKFTAGSPDNNAGSADVSSTLDDYTQRKGWSGTKVFQAGGSVKLGSSSGLGTLTTPAMNLSGNGGKFTLTFRATAWNGDSKSMKIFLDNALIYTVTDLDNSSYTFGTYTLGLTGGKNGSVIRFEGNAASGGRFFLDDITVSQDEEVILLPIANSPFTVTQTSYYISGLSVNKTYFYTVAATIGGLTSQPSSEVGPIHLISTGVETVTAENLPVWKMDGAIQFNAREGELVEVFNITGQKTATKTASEGVNEIRMHQKGVIILKVGNRVGKVVVP